LPGSGLAIKHGAGDRVAMQGLTVCRKRLFFERVRVPRKELSVHLSSVGKQRRGDPRL